MGNLFQEFKRPKVFRVVAVYTVVARLIIQIFGELLPSFDAPKWVNQSTVFSLIQDFPQARDGYTVWPAG